MMIVLEALQKIEPFLIMLSLALLASAAWDMWRDLKK